MGGYIMDASAIIQNDARIENVKAMTEFTRSYGTYPIGHPKSSEQSSTKEQVGRCRLGLTSSKAKAKPGACIPWEEKRKEISLISGDENIFRRIWEEVDSLGYLFIWQVLLSF
jgi:hypothetical protein